MKAGAIGAGLFGFAREVRTAGQNALVDRKKPVTSATSFSRDGFASEQIRGLVRHVFLSGAPPVRQVVFASVDPETDVQEVCCKVGQSLAAETAKDVAIVTRRTQSDLHENAQPFSPLRTAARQLDGSLWSLELPVGHRDSITDSLRERMQKIRHEFEYSLIAASSGASDDALFMGQVSDGMVLVVSAMRTRRAAAVRFRNALAQSRLLGTVLIDREFSVPAAIYKRI